MIAGLNPEGCDVGHATAARLPGDLLGFELAVEGFEDPVLEDFAIAGLYVSKGEAKARGAGVENDGFGFKRFTRVVDRHEDVALFMERRGGFEEATLQAKLGDTPGKSRFGRTLGSDFGSGVEGKSETAGYMAHFASLFDAKRGVEAVEGQAMRNQ